MYITPAPHQPWGCHLSPISLASGCSHQLQNSWWGRRSWRRTKLQPLLSRIYCLPLVFYTQPLPRQTQSCRYRDLYIFIYTYIYRHRKPPGASQTATSGPYWGEKKKKTKEANWKETKVLAATQGHGHKDMATQLPSLTPHTSPRPHTPGDNISPWGWGELV